MQEFGPNGITELLVPRGMLDATPLRLDMTDIYLAEQRLDEIKSVNPLTAPELKAFYNKVGNLTGKYLAWVEYEILQCEKNMKLEKARVTLDESVEAFKKFKEAGMKYNEDFREALCARDPKYSQLEDRLAMMTAVKALLKTKFDTFIRSYFSCQEKEDRKSGASGIASSPSLNGSIGQLSDPNLPSFMGTTGVYKK